MVNRKLDRLQIYTVGVTLQHIEPRISRTLVVPSSITLREFHDLLQGAFGWFSCHLHAFRDQRGMTYTSAQEGMFAMDMGEQDIDDATVQLDAVLQAEGEQLVYEYDFGDGWEHAVVLSGIGPPKANGLYPAVIDGARNCPPEDCGGPFGYMELLEIIRRKRQGKALEDHEEEQLEWLGDYDPDAFDLEEANRRMATRNKLS